MRETTARNKAIVKAFVEVAVVGFMQGERESFREYLAPDIVFHTPRLTSESSDDADGLHAEVQAYAQLLANPNLIVDFVIAEDDFVAIHLTSGGGTSSASDEPVEGGGMAILRVRDDRITDLWYYSKRRQVITAGR
jgi:ketosteroid isomerase-like protein